MDKEEKVREFLNKQKHVKLAYLFGSVQLKELQKKDCYEE